MGPRSFHTYRVQMYPSGFYATIRPDMLLGRGDEHTSLVYRVGAVQPA